MQRRSVKAITEYLTPEQIFTRYIENIKPYSHSEEYQRRDRALIAALYASGLRASELLAVQKERVEWNEDFLVFKDVQIEKQKKLKLLDKALPRKGKLAPFTEIVLNYLQHRRKGPIFPINRSRLYQIVRQCTDQWPHYFRSQHISWLVNETGLSTLNVKTITGHATVQHLESYVHGTYKQFSEQLLR